jgi:hypothetical protein
MAADRFLPRQFRQRPRRWPSSGSAYLVDDHEAFVAIGAPHPETLKPAPRAPEPLQRNEEPAPSNRRRSLSHSAPELRRTPYLSTFSDLRQGV